MTKFLITNTSHTKKERCQHLRTNQIQPIVSQEFFQTATTTATAIQNDNEIEEKIRNVNQTKIALVHAYADIPYDRSSFHLAGNAYLIADVVSFLTLDAIDSLKVLNESKIMINKKSNNNHNDNNDCDRQEKNENKGGDKSRHPLIGLVDHISVMPLNEIENDINHDFINSSISCSSDKSGKVETDSSYIPLDAHGLSCRHIGKQLQLKNKDIDIFYYGSANPNQTPLATIRREQTNFFQSGGLEKNMETSDNNNKKDENEGKQLQQSQQSKKNQCTIGSPPYFVENYNILLSKNVNKQNAMKLTKMVRARDGGVVGVEALTLPYSDGRFEVACNLLRPKEGSVNDIEHVLNQWVDHHQQQQKQQQSKGSNHDQEVKWDKSFLVDDSYRVGTTSDQCMKVLNDFQSGGEDSWKRHDDKVRKRFESYFS